MPKFTLFILLVLLTTGLKAQTWEIGGAFGGAGYMGDLNTNNPVKVSGIAAGIFVKRNFNGYFSLRLNGTIGTIAGADSNSGNQQFRNRNLSFTDKLKEVSLVGELNFLNYIPSISKTKFTPYLYLGVAVLNYNPTTVYKGQVYNLRSYQTEGEKKPYSSVAFSFPYGAGFRYNIWDKFTVGAEIGYRNPNTDYLDDVSGKYANMSNSSPIAKALADRSGEKTGVYIGIPGTQRGDFVSRDTYFFTQITISYTFISQKCYYQ
ncbi:MAG: hypothetical protein JWP45_743 [Mucilaginibacter sp.]|jgi:opacity protein-like surface antigen|nr:hypothetical protein [Mucilaginibacter sp.]MDB5140399.1 hypothetical protein [Mucilaginibacter sp.]